MYNKDNDTITMSNGLKYSPYFIAIKYKNILTKQNKRCII